MEPDALLQHAASGGAVLDLNAMPSAIGPMARRLLLAMAVLPPAAYGAHKAYQHFHGPGEEQAKEATLRRYGLRKEALSPTVRNMLLGAGIGGAAGAGLNYAFHHDKPDAGSRAAKAGLGGALLGLIAGGVLTPERAASSLRTATPQASSLKDVAPQPKPPRDVRIALEQQAEERAGKAFARHDDDPYKLKALRRDIEIGAARSREEELRAAAEKAVRHAVAQAGRHGTSNPAFWRPEEFVQQVLGTLPSE